MRKILLAVPAAVLLAGTISICSQAQTPLDGLMMKKGEICIAPMYEYGTWETYWEGETSRDNDNIGTFKRKAFAPMVVLGVLEGVNLIVSLPYIQTEATGGQMAGQDGIQDLGLSLKAEVLRKEFSNSHLKLFGNLNFSTPLSEYASDYQPFSIGLGTNELGLRAIGQYELNSGWYVRASAAYLHRGTTEAEREYYYQDGSYYTSTMDVPDAAQTQVGIGKWFFQSDLRVEASLMSFRSTSGDDIRAFNAPQPTNKVDFDRVEAFAQYYFRNIKGLGVLGYYQYMFAGRNMGQFSTVGAGVTYQFQLFNKQ